MKFSDPAVPNAVPYGVDDIGRIGGWVNVGMSGHRAVRGGKHSAVVGAHGQAALSASAPALLLITMNWRGRHLTGYRASVNLIAGTKARTGLTVKAPFDRHSYDRGIKFSKVER